MISRILHLHVWSFLLRNLWNFLPDDIWSWLAAEELTFYSIITPFDTFEKSCIWKYYENGAFAPFGANSLFSIIFSKVFKTSLKFFLKFQCSLKIENDVMIWKRVNAKQIPFLPLLLSGILSDPQCQYFLKVCSSFLKGLKLSKSNHTNWG